ncbi:hypothetical protein MRX96_033756 [Rhipicephalus microplus]
MAAVPESVSAEQRLVCAIIPPLCSERHKGQAGRIGILGGSVDFTGAPYFAGMAALRTGADLAYVLCPSSAAPAIKSYGPELMVMPFPETWRARRGRAASLGSAAANARSRDRARTRTR